MRHTGEGQRNRQVWEYIFFNAFLVVACVFLYLRGTTTVQKMHMRLSRNSKLVKGDSDWGWLFGSLCGLVTNWWLIQGVRHKTTGTGSSKVSSARKLVNNRKTWKSFNIKGKWIKAILEVLVILQQPSMVDGMRVYLAVFVFFLSSLPAHYNVGIIFQTFIQLLVANAWNNTTSWAHTFSATDHELCERRVHKKRNLPVLQHISS